MQARFDFPFSFVLSAAIHGAAAVGVYGAVVTGPSISLSGGGGLAPTYNVSFVPASALSQTAIAAVAPVQQLISSKPAELVIKPIAKAVPSVKQALPKFEPMARAALSSAAKTSDHAIQTCSANLTCNGDGSGGTSGFGNGPTQGSSLVRSPKPPYPWAARRAGFEGAVELALSIDTLGKVSQASIVKSSGRQDCDSSAIDTITKEWQFEPARVHGSPIEWSEKVVVVYSLRP